MNSVQRTRRRSSVLLLLATVLLSTGFALYGERRTEVVFFTLRGRALPAAILVIGSAVLGYAWWRGIGPKSVMSAGGSLLISVGMVGPFAVLQLVNRMAFNEGFPFVLFAFMSLHALLIVLLLAPAVRRLRESGSLRALKLGHWAGLLVGVVLAVGYADVVIDQLPCFLGVPNCD